MSAEQSTTAVKSLEEAAEKVIVKNLGELAESASSRFSCGGELSFPDKVQLLYENKAGELSKVVFPGASDADIQQLRGACSVASFGLNDQHVIDPNYRDALKLDPEHFATSFQVADTPILLAAMTMVPDVQCIRPELYKLNIYSDGGFFKAHVDTPRSEQMFGSLVVCLPTQFSGGALVTRHNRSRDVKFNWSSPPDSPRKRVSWAVFFSDVEHEVLPVTQGHRITLTYNLYAMGMTYKNVTGKTHKWIHYHGFGLPPLPVGLPAHDVTMNPFYKELNAALGNPAFMRDGGVLGFASHHRYIYSRLNSTESLPVLLKGADQMVYFVAQSLGLTVIVKPVIGDRHDFMTPCLLPAFTSFQNRGFCFEEEGYVEQIKELFGEAHPIYYITWCQKLSLNQPAGCTATYGNEPGCDVYYQDAAILVGIPKWGDYRKSCAFGSVQETTEKGSTGKEATRKRSHTDESAAILKRICFHGNGWEMPDDS